MGDGNRYEKILLVDDDKVDIYISIKEMREANFADDIVFKMSARSALDYIVETINKKDKMPDLIFLDWNLPGESCMDFLKEFRMLTRNTDVKIPVMILTNLLHSDFIMEKIATEHP